MEDYSNFSWEAIQKSLRDMIADVKKETGASDEQIELALSECAEKIMNTNGFVESRRNEYT
jgi:hypothetical protein